MEINSLSSFVRYIFSKLEGERKTVLFIISSIVIHAVCVLLVPLLTIKLIDDILPEKDYSMFFLCLIGLIFAPLLSGILMTFEDYYANKLGHKLMTKIRVKFLLKYLQTKYPILQNNRQGEFIQRIVDEPEEIAHWVYIIGIQILINGLGLISTYIYLFYIDFYLGLVMVLVLGLYILPYRLFANMMKRTAENLLHKRGEIVQVTNENLNGFYTIKALGIEQNRLTKFRNVSNDQLTAISYETSMKRNSAIIIGSAYAAGGALVYYYGGWQVLRNEMTIGVVIASKLYIDNILYMGNQLYERILQTIGKIPIADKLEKDEHKMEDIETSGDVELENVKKIQFRNVNFTFDEKQILNNFSWSVPIGKHTALVGPSGCGKSTIINLLTRIYDIESGKIYINNIPIKDYSLVSLRTRMAIVSQKPEIINASIMDNLVFGLREINEEEVIQVVNSLGLHEFIKSLPEQFNTVIGPNSVQTLSGGQQQRIVIAKMILHKPDILVLDEATSGLDEQNITFMLEAIEKYLPNVTIISITHNVRIAQHADHILFCNGREWNDGVHKHLLEQNQSYCIHFGGEALYGS